ncbi:MAG: hypothetical protein IPK82_21165 [Polyangiaceae bacterium]|nr:hypothetical protein [Polyangiaceae bacterium]
MRTYQRRVAVLLGSAAAGVALFSASEAAAQMIIRNPSDHPDYRVELEPHGTLSPWGNTFRYGRDLNRYYFNAGVGFRATIEIVDPVIPKLNNTIGITFGLDITNCGYCYPDEYSFWFPIGAQWNFFLHKKWSVFAEVGFVPHSNGFFVGDRGYDAIFVEPMFEVGGRFHFRDKITLTMRLGIPFVTVGVSFML